MNKLIKGGSFPPKQIIPVERISQIFYGIRNQSCKKKSSIPIRSMYGTYIYLHLVYLHLPFFHGSLRDFYPTPTWVVSQSKHSAPSSACCFRNFQQHVSATQHGGHIFGASRISFHDATLRWRRGEPTKETPEGRSKLKSREENKNR